VLIPSKATWVTKTNSSGGENSGNGAQARWQLSYWQNT
jgi:hypothetical protein